MIVVLNPREARERMRVPLGHAAGRADTWEDALSGARFSARDGVLTLDTLPSGAGYVLLPLKGADG